MTTIPPKEQSHIQTIPCPACDPKHPTIPCPGINILRRNKTILADEVMRLEQEYARALRQQDPLSKRIGLWADIVIAKSLLYGLKMYSDN